MAKKAIFRQLDDARAALSAITAELTEKQSARSAALLDGANVAAIAKIDAEIAVLQHGERTEHDRIELLEKAVVDEKQANAAKQQAAHIARFAKLQAARVVCAGKVQESAKDLLKNTRELIELSERARTGFAVHSASARTAADSIDGAAMSAGAIMQLLANEEFRISSVPFLGGHAGERGVPSLPGSKCPKLEWQLTPEKVMPFAERMKLASEWAVETLKKEIRAPGKNNVPRTVQVPAAVNGAEPRPRTEAELRLSDLLNQQAAVANDITEAGETKYKAIVAEIVATTAEIEAWRTETKPAEAEPRPAA
jgi:hypothetical protein